MDIMITIPAELVAAVDNYLDTDWEDGRDPTKLGALNAVAYIGERIAAIRAAHRRAVANLAKAGGKPQVPVDAQCTKGQF
jgi:hypothetical protein